MGNGSGCAGSHGKKSIIKQSIIRSRSGSSVVEAAILLFPALLLLSAVFELMLILSAMALLQWGTADAALLVRTGQAQEDGLTVDSLKSTICGRATLLTNCVNDITLEVRSHGDPGEGISVNLAEILAEPLGDFGQPDGDDEDDADDGDDGDDEDDGDDSDDGGGGGGDDSDEPTFEPGVAEDLVTVRVAYTWDIVTPIVSPFISNVGSSGFVFTTTFVFRNEPFEDGGITS